MPDPLADARGSVLKLRVRPTSRALSRSRYESFTCLFRQLRRLHLSLKF